MKFIFIPVCVSAIMLISCDFNSSKKRETALSTRNDSFIDPEKFVQIKIVTADEYGAALDQLDHGNLPSLDMAKGLLINNFTDTLTSDSMFVLFNDFYNRVAGGYLGNNESVSSRLENAPSAETINQLKSILAPYGILLGSAKGNYYLETQTAYLLQNFGPILSPAYREYLTIEGKEQKSRFAADGTILIPPDSLIARIMVWESFIDRYPDFVSVRLAQDQYAQYLSAYLVGMDNSRVFDDLTNRLNDSSKGSFESYVINNPRGKSSEVVKAYLDLLKSTNFNYTDKVDSFLLEKVYH